MPLKLSLKPGESVVINGALIENGDRRASITVQNQASILREKDLMTPEEVTSPARRIYFPVMMMYMDDAETAPHYEDFSRRMTEFMGAVSHPKILDICVQISADIVAGKHYAALVKCKKLIEYETRVRGEP